MVRIVFGVVTRIVIRVIIGILFIIVIVRIIRIVIIVVVGGCAVPIPLFETAFHHHRVILDEVCVVDHCRPNVGIVRTLPFGCRRRNSTNITFWLPRIYGHMYLITSENVILMLCVQLHILFGRLYPRPPNPISL